MAVGKVMARGQVTLPKDVRDAAGIKPGDLLSFRVTAPGKVEVTALARLRLADLLNRYRIEGPIGEARVREEWQAIAAEEVISKLDG